MRVDYLEFARVFEKVEKIERQDGGFKVTTSRGKDIRVESHHRRHWVLAGALMDVPGEKDYMMRGLCYSAVSYAPLFIERDVVVIGDTKLALRSTAELARIARKVTLVAPSHGELDTMMGRKVLEADNVEVMEGFRVEEVLGDEYARKVVVSKNGDKKELEADAFFVELELVPQSGFVADLVERDDGDHIVVDARNKTSMDGIFAAGDVTDVISEQVLISVGEGAKAALAAYEYLLQVDD